MSTNALEAVRATLLRAILIEARNGSIYDTLAKLFEGYDDSVVAIFCEMAEEERQHGTKLVQRYNERFGPVPSASEEPKEVIEGPDLEEPEAFIFDSMTVEQALQTSLRAEQSAREFYRKEALRTSDRELQQIYQELSEFEETHVLVLQRKLAERRRTGGPASE